MNPHYTMNVQLDTERRHITVSGSFSYPVTGDDTLETLTLYLHEDFENMQIESPQLADWQFDKSGDPLMFLVHARPLKLTLTEPLSPGELLQVNFAYEGCLQFDETKAIGHIGTDYTELALYAPWFPLTAAIEPATFEVAINTVPQDYPLVGGVGLRKTADGWHIAQTEPSIDCCLIGSEHFKTQMLKKLTDDFTVEVAYVLPEYQAVAEHLVKAGGEIATYLTETFGSCELKHQSVALLPRTECGGYNRKGLVVLDRFEEETGLSSKYMSGLEGYYKYLAHEMAHLWWHRASVTDWHDWLNESLAEYASLLVCRNAFGTEWFEGRIADYTAVIDTLPPIWGIDRQHDDAFDTLYRKGPALVYQWQTLVGEAAFHGFLAKFYQKQLHTTEHFLQLAEDMLGEAVRTRMEADLKR